MDGWFGFCRSALGNCRCTWLTKSIRFHIPSLFSPFPLLTVLCLNLYFKGNLPALSENTWVLGVFKPLQLHSYKSFMFYFAIPIQLSSAESCVSMQSTNFCSTKAAFIWGYPVDFYTDFSRTCLGSSRTSSAFPQEPFQKTVGIREFLWSVS